MPKSSSDNAGDKCAQHPTQNGEVGNIKNSYSCSVVHPHRMGSVETAIHVILALSSLLNIAWRLGIIIYNFLTIGKRPYGICVTETDK
jgi:hypothetical protein